MKFKGKINFVTVCFRIPFLEECQKFLHLHSIFETIKINNICSIPCGEAITFDAFPGISQSMDNIDWRVWICECHRVCCPSLCQLAEERDVSIVTCSETRMKLWRQSYHVLLSLLKWTHKYLQYYCRSVCFAIILL